MDVHEALQKHNYRFLKDWYITNGQKTLFKAALTKDLDQYAKDRLIELVVKEAPKQSIKSTETVSEKMRSKPKEVQDLYNLARHHFKLMKEARYGIYSDDYDVRKSSALKVVEHMKANKQAWSQIDHFEKFGYIPTDLELDQELDLLNVWDLCQLYYTDKNYVFKYSNKLKSEKDEQIKKDIEARLHQRIVRRDMIEFKLKSYESR